MRNVILQIKAMQCLVLSLFMPFYFLLCWHGCTCQEALKDIIGVVKNYWEARTFPCSNPPLLFPICHHLMWQSFYRALRQRRLKVNTAIRKQLGGKCNTFHTKLNQLINLALYIYGGWEGGRACRGMVWFNILLHTGSLKGMVCFPIQIGLMLSGTCLLW